MDRLTWEYIEGGFYVDGTEISPSDFEGHTVYYGPAVDRLAAYEASGKSPEEVAQAFAENARLAKELQGAKANGMIQEHIISSGHNPQDRDTIVRVIMENSALSAENARLRAERDKAVADMKVMAIAMRESEELSEGCCFACIYDAQNLPDNIMLAYGECPGYDRDDCFDWRGTEGKA